MNLAIYFFIAFIVFYFLWKRYAVPAIENMSNYDSWFELLGFHKAVWGALFWPLSLTMVLIWNLLEYLTNKLQK